MPQEKIESLWRIFCKFDSQSKGYVTLDDFYDKLIKYPRNGLTDQMTKIIGEVCVIVLDFVSLLLNKGSSMKLVSCHADVNNNGHLVFGEFLEVYIVKWPCIKYFSITKLTAYMQYDTKSFLLP